MTRNFRTRHERPENPYRKAGVRPRDRLRLNRGFVVRDYKEWGMLLATLTFAVRLVIERGLI